jgi:heptosyltransferase II
LKKILVIQTASIGDVILATPVLEKLHHFYPEAAIDLLVKNGMEGLFTGHPFLHELIVWQKKSDKYSHLFRLLKKIRHSRYDLVVNIQRFAATGFLAAFSNAKETTGFSKNPFSFLFTKRIVHEISPGVHEVARNLKLIAPYTGDSFAGPRLYPSASDQAKTAQYKTGAYYTISPASLWYTKQYPVEKWIEFMGYIDEKTKVYLLGSGQDTELCDRIIRESGHKNTMPLAGKLTFLESAALMKDARMNFTNDSAPMHLASAVNAPVTVIYCSTVPGFGFGPLSDDAKVVEITEKLECRPCGLHGFNACPRKHFRCATDIDVLHLSARL